MRHPLFHQQLPAIGRQRHSGPRAPVANVPAPQPQQYGPLMIPAAARRACPGPGGKPAAAQGPACAPTTMTGGSASSEPLSKRKSGPPGYPAARYEIRGKYYSRLCHPQGWGHLMAETVRCTSGEFHAE